MKEAEFIKQFPNVYNELNRAGYWGKVREHLDKITDGGQKI